MEIGISPNRIYYRRTCKRSVVLILEKFLIVGDKHVIADLAEFRAEDGEDLQSALHNENVEGDSALAPAISNAAVLKAGHGVNLETSRTVKPRRKHGSKRHSYDFDTSMGKPSSSTSSTTNWKLL